MREVERSETNPASLASRRERRSRRKDWVDPAKRQHLHDRHTVIRRPAAGDHVFAVGCGPLTWYGRDRRLTLARVPRDELHYILAEIGASGDWDHMRPLPINPPPAPTLAMDTTVTSLGTSTAAPAPNVAPAPAPTATSS